MDGDVPGDRMVKMKFFLGSTAFWAFGLALAASAPETALAQSSGGSNVPKVDIHPHNPNVIQLPVIPQGNYLDPGPGAPIRPDVSEGDGRNEDYVFPPNLDGFMGGSPPGDPTADGQWSPLPGDTPSF